MKHLLLSLSLVFSAAAVHASAIDSPQTTVATPAAPKMAVSVKGATSTPAKAPLLLSLHGEPAAEPDFAIMAQTAKKHPEWTVENLKPEGDSVRVSLRSNDKKATLAMDTAQSMVEASKLVKGSKVTMTTQKVGQAELLRIMKDNIPMGFMASDNVQALGAAPQR